MKVILKEDVPNLGDIGEVVTVASGYARNYLIPRNLAVEASTRNIKYFEHLKRAMAARVEKARKEKQSLAEKIGAVTLTFTARAGEDGKLFGSITSMDVQKKLQEEGIDIDRKRIIIPDPIKRVGEYTVQVKLHSDIFADLKLQIVAE